MMDPPRDLQHGVRPVVPLVLVTERLRFRPWRTDDFEAYAEQYTDADRAHFIGGATTREDAWRRFASVIGHWALRGHGYWAVEELDGGRFVGSVGLGRPEGWPDLEVGYWLVPSAHGKGYATEAAAAARDCAFDEMRAETLISLIHPDNEPSKRVAERLGGVAERVIELLNFGPHWIYRYPNPGQAAPDPSTGARPA